MLASRLMVEAMARIQLVDELDEYNGDLNLVEWALEKEIQEEKEKLLSSGESVEWDMEMALVAWEDKLAAEMDAFLDYLDGMDDEDWDEEDGVTADDELRSELFI